MNQISLSDNSWLRWTFIVLLVGSLYAPRACADDPPREALTLYSEAASLQNNKEFELAAELWESFLKKYPQVDLAAKAQHYLGVCYLQTQKIERAMQAFGKVVSSSDKHPDFPLIQEAYLNLGWCQFKLAQRGGSEQQQLFQRAARSFTKLLEKFPKGKFVDQALYFHAESLYLLGKKQESLPSYQRLVDEFPQSPLRESGMYALGVAAQEIKRYDVAGETFTRFLREFAESPLVNETRMRRADTILQTGLAHAEAGRDQQAQRAFATAEEQFSQVAGERGFDQADHALYQQAFCAVKQGRELDAAKLYAQVYNQFERSEYRKDSAISAGRLFYRAKDDQKARTWFQTVIANDSDNATEASHWLCQILLRNQDPAGAFEVATQALAASPRGSFVAYLKMDRADAAYDLPNRRERSTQYYLDLARQHADHQLAPQALYNAAFGALQTKDFDGALDTTQKFIDQYAGDSFEPDVKYVRAEVYLLTEKHSEAENEYERLVSDYPQHADLSTWQVRLALARYLQKKYDDVIAQLKPLTGKLADASQLAEAHFLIGASQFYRDRFQPAADSLQRCLKTQADWQRMDEALLLLSQCKAKLDQHDQAVEFANRLLKDYSNSQFVSQAHYRLGEYHYELDNYDQSVTNYDTLIRSWPNSPFVPFSHYGKAWSLLKLKKFDQATEEFTELLDRFPNHQMANDARIGRGICLRQSGKHSESIKDIDAFLASNPAADARANAIHELSMALVAVKDYDRAIKALRELIKLDPDSPSADQFLYELAWAYRDLGDPDQALDTFSQIASKHPDSIFAAESNFHVGDHHYKAGAYDKATTHYRLAQQKANDANLAEKASYKLGWSLFQLKQYDHALQAFRQQVAQNNAGDFVLDGSFMIGECLFRSKKYPEALEQFNAVRQSLESSQQVSATTKDLLWLHGGQAAAQLKQWKTALSFVDKIPKNHADSEYLVDAWFEIGRAYQGLSDEDKAIEAYEKSALMSQKAVSARSRCMIGEIHFLNKEYDEAIKHFKRAIYGYQGLQAPADVRKWQAFAAYEAARCYHIQISQTNDATQRGQRIERTMSMYRYLAENYPESRLAAEGKKQLEALAKIQRP